MAPLKYPIGIQTFEEIRTDGWAYADKSRYVYQLANTSKQVFLSRPRRFGKSLLLSTFEAYFEGRKELFEGLEIENLETKWDSYPVLHFSFGSMAANETSIVERYISNRLREFEAKFAVKINDAESSVGDRFGMLIKNVAEKIGRKVVVLIDEYDKGIVEMLHDEKQLLKNIETFRPFYTQLKDQDKYLRFVLLTGVSRFNNLTLFSSPNQLQDISMDSRYASICGLTSEELHIVFAQGIEDLAAAEGTSVEDIKELLRLKYDSYRFTKKDTQVYNPFSILNCLDMQNFSNYWITSGATKVFIDYLKKAKYNIEEIEGKWVSEETLGGAYSLTNPIPLLFQTGYLTVTDYRREMYRLGIPNSEVRSALLDQLVPQYLGIDSDDARIKVSTLGELANHGDAEGLMKEFQSILSQATHQHFRMNDVENIYNLSIWLICKMAGINARSEVSVAGGDIDMVIETRNYVYVLEFKKDHSARKALEQIDTKAYALPWQADDRQVFKIGVEFSSANRNITNWEIA